MHATYPISPTSRDQSHFSPLISYTCIYLSFLPNDKFLDWSKLKTFAGDKIKVTGKMKFVLEMVENIVGKGENAGYQHFLLFLQYFQKDTFSRSLKVGIV